MIELQATWGGLAAMYLFLGGVAAGAFIATAVLRFVYPGKLARVQMIGAWTSLACLAVGLGCLVVEVEKPLQALLLPLAFNNFASVMTIGAWLLLIAFAVFAAYALLATPKVAARVGEEKARAVLRVLAWVGALLAVGVAVYTGVLLSAAGAIPLWDTPLLPVLFTVSALGTGVAAVSIVCVACARGESEDAQAHQGRLAAGLLGKAACVLVVLEACALAAFVTDAASRGVPSAEAMVSGQLSLAFWLAVVAVGLIVPFVLSIAGVVMAKRGAAFPWQGRVALVEATCALVGGFALRAVVLFAGVHAALASPLALQAAHGVSFIVG